MGISRSHYHWTGGFWHLSWSGDVTAEAEADIGTQWTVVDNPLHTHTRAGMMCWTEGGQPPINGFWVA